MVIAATRDTLIAAVFLYLLCIRFGDERTDDDDDDDERTARATSTRMYIKRAKPST